MPKKGIMVWLTQHDFQLFFFPHTQIFVEHSGANFVFHFIITNR